jgi:hypothetical protein
MPSEFAGAGESEGLQVWRIEKKLAAPIPAKLYGQFYEGDSYLVLKTSKRGSSFEWSLFYWLGKDSEVEEQGICAYKAVELDDLLGGAPVQHREAQGHESDEFLQCFKTGVTYLPGGVDSGFTHVVRDVYVPQRLDRRAPDPRPRAQRTMHAYSLAACPRLHSHVGMSPSCST